MGKKQVRENFYVHVWPRDAGDLGGIYIGGLSRTESEEHAFCETMLREILRHVDGVHRNSFVSWDSSVVCEHCGSQWTEESDAYNGGCCKDDVEPALAEMEGETDG